MNRSIEQALRGCGEGEVAAVPGLLDQVRRRMFGLAPPATSLGRYRLFEVVGAGGGGVVVRAEDPELGREVAIKLVYGKARGDEDAARRLLREARALARLSHPDIVTIYDVGRVDGDRDTALERLVGASVDGSVYLVMQWCDGGDLSQWLATGERPWSEIVDAFAAAGRGLAAAHAAGLLHRDFKPANVLLDRAGRPRVADFGLGRVGPSWTGLDPDTVLDGPTRSDAIVGTPMYMSPEQHLGDEIDPRSDQYSFCFALREALFGRIAFGSLTDLVRAKLDGLPLGEARGIPRSVALVIARGIARDPARRWPSMDAMLVALARARRPKRRAPLAFGVGAMFLLGAALGSRTTPAPCSADAPGWAAVWGEPREAIADVFARADGFGRESFAAVDERMSALGREWSDARARICAGAEPEPGIACLERQRVRAAAMVDAWRAAERDGIADALGELAKLDAPDRCVWMPERELASTDADGSLTTRIDALLAAGRIGEAATLADALDDSATPSERISAAAAFERAARYADAERELTFAVHEAEANDDAAITLRASARLVAVVGAKLHRPDEAERWGRHAWAALARVDDDGLLAAEVHESLGMFAHASGQWQRALEHFEDASYLVTTLRPDDELRRAALLASAAGARVQLGRYAEAITGFEEAIAIQRELVGDGHPGLAMTRHNLAIALSLTGNVDRARDEATRALDAWVVAYRGQHPDIALGHQTLASICRNTGDLAGSIAHAQESRRLRIALAGPDHPDTLTAELALANAYNSAGRLDEAQDLFAHVVEAHEADPTLTPNGGIAWMNLGDVQRRRGDFASARTSLRRARELLVVSHGQRHLAVALALLNLGVVAREDGSAVDAIAILDEAEPVLRDAVGSRHPRLASLWHERGQASAKLGDRAAARKDYEQAIALLDGVPHVEAERASIEQSRAALEESR